VTTGLTLCSNHNYTVTVDDIGPPCWNVDIETLPNEILLEIIDLYLGKDRDDEIGPWYAGWEGNQRDPYDA